MKINTSKLEAVAVKRPQYPSEDISEIAFAGRSNVGKSSLLNLLTGRKSLAHVSSAPGKTRTINFYLINEGGENEFRIVDLPGYGYAKVSHSKSDDWADMMESYLSARQNLKKVVQLVDIRHEPTAQDVQMYEYLRYYGLSGIVVATKADKVSHAELDRGLRSIRKKLELTDEDKVFPVSALKKTGYAELLDEIERII